MRAAAWTMSLCPRVVARRRRRREPSSRAPTVGLTDGVGVLPWNTEKTDLALVSNVLFQLQ